MFKILFILILNINFLFGGYIGKGGLYDFKFVAEGRDGSPYYRIYCVNKNSIFSISNHRVFKNTNGKWYDALFMDNPKYMGMTFDNLDTNQFGEKVCR